MVGYRHMTTRFPIAGTAVLRLTRTITVRDREDSENAVVAAEFWESSRMGGRRCAAWRRRTDLRVLCVLPEQYLSVAVPEEDDTVQSSLTHAPESRSWVVEHE